MTDLEVTLTERNKELEDELFLTLLGARLAIAELQNQKADLEDELLLVMTVSNEVLGTAAKRIAELEAQLENATIVNIGGPFEKDDDPDDDDSQFIRSTN